MKCLDLQDTCGKEYRDFFALADECFTAGGDLITGLEKLQDSEYKFDRYHMILGFNFFKATNSFLAILKLCQHGFCGDAMSIGRKLIEIAINLKFLSLDRDSRIDKYCGFGSVANRKMIHDIKTESEDEADPQFTGYILRQIEIMTPQIEETCRKLGAEMKAIKPFDPNGHYKTNWAGISLKKMAKRCDMKEDYIAYRVYSGKVHASIEEIVSHYDFKKRRFSFDLEKADVPWVIMESIKMYLLVARLVDEAFELNTADRLDRLDKDSLRLKEHPILTGTVKTDMDNDR